MNPRLRTVGSALAAIRRRFVVTAAMLMAMASGAAFAEAAVSFDIPRQPLSRALTAFARQTGISVLFPFDAVSHLTANRLKGEYSIEEGLELLLAGTGMTAGFKAGQLTVQIVEGESDKSMSGPQSLHATTESSRQQTGFPPANRLEEITVTARHRAESIRQIPSAVSALTSDTLAANSAGNVLDVAAWAPNVTFDQLGQGYGSTLAANIRGLGYGDFKATSDPTVIFYVDDVVLSRSTGAVLDLLDVERVEVLRGPQGTLFGKNAIGGVVRLISRKPGGGDRNGYLEVTRGEFDRFDVRGSFESELLPERVFSRVSFVSKRRDGYMNNVDFRCAMLRAGTPELAGVGDGIVGWDSANDMPITGTPFSAEDNAFAVPTRVSDDAVQGDCVVDKLGGQSMQAARAMLSYQPGGRVEVYFSADITDQDDTSPYELTSQIASPPLTEQYNRLTALPNYGVPYDSRFTAPDIDTSYAGFDIDSRVDGGIAAPNVNEVRHWGASSTIDLQLNKVGMKFILAHREFDAFFGQDADGSPLALNHFVYDIDNSQDTVELRVNGTAGNDEWLAWTAGYFRLSSFQLDSNVVQQVPCVYAMSCIDRVDSVWADHAAIFANAQMDLSDRWSLTVGLRRSDDDKQVLQERFDRAGRPCCGFEDLPPIPISASKTDRMLSLAYDVSSQVLVYGSYQEGYRSGGTTARPTATTRIHFAPETLENIEFGLKSALLDDRIQINAAVFDMTYRDIQQNAAGVDADGQLAFVTANAGDGSIRGFELETLFTIGDHWTLGSSVGHIDYELSDLGNVSPEALLESGLTVLNAADLNDGPSRTPDYTMSLNAGYFTQLGTGAGLSVRYGVSWRDDAWLGVRGDADEPANFVPAHALSNFRLAWVSANRDWEGALFCTNCANVRTTSSRLNFLALTGHLSETYIRPAEWGVSVKRIF